MAQLVTRKMVFVESSASQPVQNGAVLKQPKPYALGQSLTQIMTGFQNIVRNPLGRSNGFGGLRGTVDNHRISDAPQSPASHNPVKLALGAASV